MALPERGKQLLDLMLLQGFGERPIFFIGHSLGGLVTKQILRSSSDSLLPREKQIFDNTRAVLFIATPHSGAELATLADMFQSVFGPTVTLKGLQLHDAHLGELFNWYRNHSQGVGIQTATYFERLGVRIVNSGSSHPGCGDDPVPLDEDHLSIAKPRTQEAQVFLGACDLVRRFVLVPRRPEAKEAQQAKGLRVPHELPPAAEAFFGRGVEVRQVVERLRAGKNTAVVGPAGLGKTAVAAEALQVVVGKDSSSLAENPFSDGVVYLDLYALRGSAEGAWNRLANRLKGVGFHERLTGRERASEACRGLRMLLVVEGGEEADGREGRADIAELFSVLSLENRWLLLTRLSTQANAAESVVLKEALDPAEAAQLFDSLTGGKVSVADRDRALELLAGHPLALTWAGNLFARDEENAGQIVTEWEQGGLPKLSDPSKAEHTLGWLFERSTKKLNDEERLVLGACALLSNGPFALAAMDAVLVDQVASGKSSGREALLSLVRRGLLRRASVEEHWQFTHILGYQFARKEWGSDSDVRQVLGHWLRGEIERELEKQEGDGAIRALGGLWEHVAALLRADDDQCLWEPIVNVALYEFSDRLVDLGRLGDQRLVLGAVAGWFEGFSSSKGLEEEWQRERSVLKNRVGKVLKDQGDLAGALAAFRQSLEIRRRLAEADSSNSGWQRDLSVSHVNVGYVLKDQGDLAGALAAFRQSLEISRRLAEADSSNAGWQSDLSFSLTRMAQLYESQDRAQALLFALESLAIDERLAALDPSNVNGQNDVRFIRSLVERLRG